MSVMIDHNPDCRTSRNTLAMVRHAGFELDIIEYLKALPHRYVLESLKVRAGRTVRAVLRDNGTLYADSRRSVASIGDEHLLDAILKRPIRINRPLVVTPLGGRLRRPSNIDTK
jgi:arsenate reductase (glutaredoxin)